jgi:mycofactocin precursor
MEPNELSTPIGAAPADESGETDDMVDDELLVEEISIDGMCGVY